MIDSVKRMRSSSSSSRRAPPPSPSGSTQRRIRNPLPDPQPTSCAAAPMQPAFLPVGRGSARRTGSSAHERGVRAAHLESSPSPQSLSVWGTFVSLARGTKDQVGHAEGTPLQEPWLAVRTSLPARLLFSSPQTWTICFFSPANIRTGMERITRKCLTYSHVHASYLRGPPTRLPLSRAERPSHRVMQRPGCFCHTRACRWPRGRQNIRGQQQACLMR